MRPLPIVLATALLALAPVIVLADDADEVRRLDKEITVATWASDEVWFENNLADDFVLVMPTGGMQTKKDVIRGLATPGMAMEPYDPKEVTIRMYGDAAVVTGRILQRYTLGGIRYANDLRYTGVYVKKKNRWLLASTHYSSMAVKR
jgi:ketosteroid isomerase-like protein